MCEHQAGQLRQTTKKRVSWFLPDWTEILQIFQEPKTKRVVSMTPTWGKGRLFLGDVLQHIVQYLQQADRLPTIWEASRDARLLASSPDVQTLVTSINTFHSTFHDFIKLIDRSGTRVEYREHFYQTWDECDDFLHDYNVFQSGTTKVGSLRPYTGARYVYTSKDVKYLERRMVLLLYIMQATIDDILLDQLIHIHATSEENPDSFNKNPSLGLNIKTPLVQQPGGKSPEALNKDTSVLVIYDSLKGIRYQLKRTGTQVASPGETNTLSWSLDRGDINQIWRLLRARFRQHHIQSHDQSLGSISSTFYDDQDEKGLQEFSSKKLDRLRKEYRRRQSYLTTRKRVYGNNPIEFGSSIPVLSLPRPALGGGEVTITIKDTPINEFAAHSVDVVNCPMGRLIVCCLEKNDAKYTGTLHFLPPIAMTYPYTFHKALKPPRFESEVSMHEGQICEVSMVNKGQYLVERKPLIPLYNFTRSPDASAFQTTLKEKYLRHTFQMDKITSHRGREALYQPLKLWIGPDDKSYSITFLKHWQFETVSHLEFSLADFEHGHPFPHTREPTCIQITFRRKINNTNKRSRGSIDSIKRKISWAASASVSSLMNRRRSSTSSITSDDATNAADPGLPETDPQSPTESQNDPMELMEGTSIPHPYAEVLKYLNLTFSTKEEMETFTSYYVEIKSERTTPSPSPNSPRSGHKNSTPQSWRTSPLIEDGDVPDPFPAPPSIGCSGQSIPNATIDRPARARTPPLPKPKVLGKVYRVKGIPQEFGIDDTKTMLRLGLDLNESTKINIRSLAISEHRGEKVSVVEFTPEPAGLASEKNQWPYNIEMLDERKIGITIDTHFRGLTVLRSPSSKDHNVDICAVSGLGGHGYGSFKERSEAGGSWMWILDSLGSESAFSGARLLLYGSDTKLAGNDSTQELSGLGDDLRSDLEALMSKKVTNTEHGIVPLIFIAHSLGGLVVKEALIYGMENCEQCEQFASSTHGALFFGVPNQGMKNDALEKIVGGKANSALVHSLREDGDKVTNQSMRFNNVIKDLMLDMIYFYEEKETAQTVQDETTGQVSNSGPKVTLVSKSSATNGMITTNKAVTHDILRNHSELVKFGKHDRELLKVIDVLEKMVRRALKRAAGEPFETPLEAGSRQSREFPSPRRKGTGFSEFSAVKPR